MFKGILIELIAFIGTFCTGIFAGAILILLSAEESGYRVQMNIGKKEEEYES